jgi:PAS domain S-box-containing protein
MTSRSDHRNDEAPESALRPRLARYLTSIVTAGLGLGAGITLHHEIGINLPYLTLYASTMLAAWLAGLGPGLVCVALTAAGACWFWLPPTESFEVSGTPDRVGLILYTALASLIVLVTSAQRRAGRRAEAASVESDRLLRETRTILESISDSFYALDREFRFTYLNSQAADYFRRTVESLIGKPIWEAMPEKLGTVFETSFRKAASRREPIHFEALSPVGHRWVEVQVYPTEHDGLSVFVRDLSERRALQLGEERMRQILSSATDAIITIDESERITLFSAGAEQIFRCSAAHAIGQPIERFIPERFRAEHHGFIAAFSRTGVSSRAMGSERVLSALRADGQEFPMEARISQSVAGTEKLYTVILRDVTERKQAEREREELLERARTAALEAASASRSKDEFLAIVSHELRTPLTPILTWASMLRRQKLDGELAERGLQTIERAARAQAQLVEDLLDVSRIVAGKMRLDVQPIEIAAVIGAAVESLTPAAAAKGIRLQVVLDPRAGVVSADRERLQQVMWNLLSNAIKFTPKGGRVHVILQRVNSHVEIVVRDTGEGIPPEFLPQVFAPFLQRESSTTRTHGGLGLGLAIVRHLVELHGGSVRCESPGVGAGSVFTVTIPMAPLQHLLSEQEVHPGVGVAARTSLAPTLDGLRVLLVDDERDTLDALEVALAGAGADVRTANSVARAVEILDEWRPGVIVSDIGMPGQDGYALIRRVRERPAEQGGRVPAVALTAYARIEDRLRVLSAGFQMHVSKPIEPAELIAVVASAANFEIRAG